MTGNLSPFVYGTHHEQALEHIKIDTQVLNVGDNTICQEMQAVARYDVTAGMDETRTVSVLRKALEALNMHDMKEFSSATSSIYAFTDEFLYREHIEQHNYDQMRDRVIKKRLDSGAVDDSFAHLIIKK